MSTKSVLITGCSAGGIGHALVLSFQQRGFHVFATARSIQKMQDLTALPNVHLLSLDVTSPSSIHTAKKEVEAQTGGKLDVLVNNAGAQFIMPALDVDINAAKEHFEVNYWSPLRMIQAFADMLIAAKGCVVNIASVAGVTNLPFQSQYSASKAAIASLSETMRLELAPLNVRVITVMAGSVQSNIFDNSPGPAKLPPTSFYRSIESLIPITPTFNETPAKTFSEQIVADVLRGATGRVWHADGASIIRCVVPFMPQWLYDKIMLSMGRGLETMPKH